MSFDVLRDMLHIYIYIYIMLYIYIYIYVCVCVPLLSHTGMMIPTDSSCIWDGNCLKWSRPCCSNSPMKKNGSYNQCWPSTWIYIYIINIYIHHVTLLYVKLHWIYTHIYIYTYTYIHIYIYTHIYIHIYTYRHIYSCTFTCIYIYI